MFYYYKAENDSEKPSEISVYFSGAKAIRINADAKTRERLTAKDLGIVSRARASCVRVKELFNRSIKL